MPPATYHPDGSRAGCDPILGLQRFGSATAPCMGAGRRGGRQGEEARRSALDPVAGVFFGDVGLELNRLGDVGLSAGEIAELAPGNAARKQGAREVGVTLECNGFVEVLDGLLMA